MAGFGISGVEPSGSATRELVILVSVLNQPQFDLIPFSSPFWPHFQSLSQSHSQSTALQALGHVQHHLYLRSVKNSAS